MRLLIITQKADQSDPILGFFHRWIEEFAAKCDSVTVIAQKTGEFHFESNVKVFSLGKEDGRSKIRQVLRFWMLMWNNRNSYDCVLVHMTPIWVILGWPIWFVIRKPLFLWYEIRRGSLKLSLALLLVEKVFSATVHGLPSSSKKQVVTGHGIDLQTFIPDPSKRERGLVIAVGRITRSKHFDVILKVFAQLPPTTRLLIAGGIITNADSKESSSLERLMRALGITDRVTIDWVPPSRIAAILQRADLMLHACEGGLDKTVLEAMACGCPVVSSSPAAQEVLSESCQATGESMGERAGAILAMSDAERSVLSLDLRRRVEASHDLRALIRNMAGIMERSS
ncbi:MAG: glycosyltransferase [Candidatus Peregrinibacteria bacterium]